MQVVHVLMMCPLIIASQALSPVLSGSLLPRLLTSPSATGCTHGLELLHSLLQSPTLRLSLNQALLTPDLESHNHPAIPTQVQRSIRHVSAPTGTSGKRGSTAVVPAPEVIDLSAAAEDDVCVITLVPGTSRAEQSGVRFGGCLCCCSCWWREKSSSKRSSQRRSACPKCSQVFERGVESGSCIQTCSGHS